MSIRHVRIDYARERPDGLLICVAAKSGRIVYQHYDPAEGAQRDGHMGGRPGKIAGAAAPKRKKNA